MTLYRESRTGEAYQPGSKTRAVLNRRCSKPGNVWDGPEVKWTKFRNELCCLRGPPGFIQLGEAPFIHGIYVARTRHDFHELMWR